MKTLSQISEALTAAALPEYIKPAQITDLAAAIERSISHTEITKMQGDGDKLVELLEDTDAVTELDYVLENDGSLDVWWDGEDFRIRIV